MLPWNTSILYFAIKKIALGANNCIGGHLALTERKCDIVSREHQVPVRPLRRAGHGWTRCLFHCALAYSHVALKYPDFAPWRMILFVLSVISLSVLPYSRRSLYRLAHSSWNSRPQSFVNTNTHCSKVLKTIPDVKWLRWYSEKLNMCFSFQLFREKKTD